MKPILLRGETEAHWNNRTSPGPQVLLKLLKRTHIWATLLLVLNLSKKSQKPELLVKCSTGAAGFRKTRKIPLWWKRFICFQVVALPSSRWPLPYCLCLQLRFIIFYPHKPCHSLGSYNEVKVWTWKKLLRTKLSWGWGRKIERKEKQLGDPMVGIVNEHVLGRPSRRKACWVWFWRPRQCLWFCGTASSGRVHCPVHCD